MLGTVNWTSNTYNSSQLQDILPLISFEIHHQDPFTHIFSTLNVFAHEESQEPVHKLTLVTSLHRYVSHQVGQAHK